MLADFAERPAEALITLIGLISLRDRFSVIIFLSEISDSQRF
jgi:hypothetical protein